MKASDLSGKIKVHAESRGHLYFKHIATYPKGHPDCTVVMFSDTYYFEIKVGKDTESPHQRLKRLQLNNTNLVSFIVRTFDEFLEIFQELEKKYVNTEKKDLTSLFKSDSIKRQPEQGKSLI